MSNVLKKVIKKSTYNFKLHRQKKHFFSNQKNTFDLSSEQIKKSNKLGFTADEYIIYDLEKNDPNDYISEWERQCFRERVRDYRILLDNKIVFFMMIKNFAEVNEIYAYKENGHFVAINQEFSEKTFIEQLKKIKRIVYKKTNAGGGEGFKLLEYKNKKFFINRKEVNQNNIEELLIANHYLIENFCEQGDFENSLWPYSVNTLRIITLEDENGVISIGAAFQRMGVEKESCVDNACAGGIYSEIDIETGTLSKARSHAKNRTFDKNGRRIEYSFHPVTKHNIEGSMIPNWKQIKEEIIALHKKLSFTSIPFIAWDIALKNDGYIIIEANTSCGVALLQTFHGVRNKTIGKWMKEKKYIS